MLCPRTPWGQQARRRPPTPLWSTAYSCVLQLQAQRLRRPFPHGCCLVNFMSIKHQLVQGAGGGGCDPAGRRRERGFHPSRGRSQWGVDAEDTSALLSQTLQRPRPTSLGRLPHPTPSLVLRSFSCELSQAPRSSAVHFLHRPFSCCPSSLRTGRATQGRWRRAPSLWARWGRSSASFLGGSGPSFCPLLEAEPHTSHLPSSAPGPEGW